MDVDDFVKDELKQFNAPPETILLWEGLLRAYDAGGPRKVKELLQTRVQEARKRAGKEARAVGKVVVATSPRRKSKR